jgi:D-alanyl-D-alanine carboxypeptidase/D-alanyl-D-alanine-endopeptidase (penicillin-binding protein 4)
MAPPEFRTRLSIPAILLASSLTAAFAAQAPVPTPAATPEATAPLPLAGRLAALLRQPAFNPEETAVVVALLPEGETVFARHAEKPLRPASTLKILTSAAALALLKPEFTYETRILADGEPDGTGTVQGNLYLKGSGAPDLVGESWWLIARRIASQGLRRVTGDLVADESHFDSVRRPAGWPPLGADSWYNAPVGALSCNFNVVTVRVDPAPVSGSRPDITLEPSASYFQVLNRAATTNGPNTLKVDRFYENGQNALTVTGSIRRGGGPLTFHRAVEEPALYAAHAFREIARREGIVVEGGIVTGTAPDTARLLHSHESRPLGALIRDMNKNSNNFMAEALVKTIGAQFVGAPGTTASGLEVIRTYLGGLGIDLSTTRLADGSGLSDETFVPARVLAELLVRSWSDFEIGPELTVSLPIGGADGTLDARFAGEEARRRLRAKTGRIAPALTLAGYATNRDGRPFAFVLFANHPRGTIEAVHRAMDRFLDEILRTGDADLAAPAAVPAGS